MGTHETGRISGWNGYRRLLGYALVDWRGWAFIVVMTFLSGAFGLLQPWPMKVLLDYVIAAKAAAGASGWVIASLPGADTARGLLAWVVAAGLAVFVVNTAADVLLTRAWTRVGQQTVYRLAEDLLAHLLRRSLLFHRQTTVGDSLSRITGDSWCVYKVVDMALFTPQYAALTITGMLVLMARMDAGLTLLAVSVAPVMAGSSLAFGRTVRDTSRARREAESLLQSHVHQTLTGIPVVQAFVQEEREQRRFQEVVAAILRARWRGTLFGSLSGLTSGLTVTLGTGAVLWVGASHVLHGRLSLGDLLVFLAYLGCLQGQLEALAGAYLSFQEAGASIDRVLEVLGSGPEVADAPGVAEPGRARGHVRLEGVGFGYQPNRPVLRGVTLEARPGQTVAVVGATGAGKTTLVSLVPRLFDPWAGRVLLDGRDARTLRLAGLRRQVGLVPQEPFLFPVSVAANIAYGRPAAPREAVVAAARAAHLHDFIMGLPDGYDTVLGERGVTLSGGQRQRLSIARALVRDAPILILDEPTSALDAETEWLFLQALARLKEGRTTFIIAHRLFTVRDADQIVVLDQGVIAESGTHPDLLARGGHYARLYEAQTGTRVPAPPLAG